MLSICIDHWCAGVPKGTGATPHRYVRTQVYANTGMCEHKYVRTQVCANIHRIFQAFVTEQSTNYNGKFQAAEHHIVC